MKLNISYPATGSQKLVEIVDDHKLRVFYEKRMGMEVPADSIGDEWKGYIFRIAGGNDKQGFPMKQGVLSNSRVRLLLSKGHSCYRPRRTGERKRKSVRGCIVDSNLSVLAVVVVRKGEQEIPGLTDTNIPRRLGPKRASKIRKLFNLGKKDDVRQYVIKRLVPAKPAKDGKKKVRKLYKAPKIQRLITPVTLQRKRHLLALKKRRCLKRKEQAAEYAKLLALRLKEKRKLKAEERKRRRTSSMRLSKSSSVNEPAATQPKQVKPAPVVAAAPAPKQAKAAPAAPAKPAAKGAKGAAPAVPAKGAKGAKESAAPAKGAKGAKTQAAPAGKGAKAAPAQTGKGAKTPAAPASGKGAKAPAGKQEKAAPAAKGAKAPAAPAKGAAAKPKSDAAPAKGAKSEGGAKSKPAAAAATQQKAAPKSGGQPAKPAGQPKAAAPKKSAPSGGAASAPAKKAKK